MADKRMFSNSIMGSDAYLDMPLSAQALYVQLCLNADDEGFVGSPKKIQRMTGAADGDAQMLVMKNFIIAFDSGVIVIKHWKIHNTIRQDRFKPTNYIDEKAQLTVKENGAYTLCQPSDNQLTTNCQPSDGLGKYSIDQYSIGECQGPPTQDEVDAYCKERHNNVDAKRFYNYYAARGWETNGAPIKDWKALLRLWEPKDMGDPKAAQKRLNELEMKRASLIAAGASKEDIEVVDLNIQSIKDTMEVGNE